VRARLALLRLGLDEIMKARSCVLLALLFLCLTLGCGGDREKGMNSPNQKKDLPRAAPTEKNK
jgi:hypothetical protein